MIDHFYKDIQGWFHGEELIKEMIDKAPKNRNTCFVEIGCWKGQSTAFIGVEILKSGKPITLISVDTFKGSDELAHLDDPELKKLKSIYTTNTSRLRKCGLNHVIVESTSELASRDDYIYPIFFTYIDGSHEYDDVVKDIKAWYPKTTYAIGGDDIELHSVTCAVYDMFKNDAQGLQNNQWWHKIDIHKRLKFDTKQYRVMIATPTHDSKLWVGYVDSLVNELRCLAESGIDYVIPRYDGDSHVTRCRNIMAADFMRQQQCTHMMWIDSDIAWPVGIIRDLVLQDRPIIAGAYPKKRLPVQFVLNAKTQSIDITDSRFIEINDAGTGFLLIRRDVYETIKPNVDHLFAKNLSMCQGLESHEQYPFAREFYNYFGEMCDPLDDPHFGTLQNWLSEDYAFCRRAQNAGFQILLAPLVPLDHFGSYCYAGDVAQHIEVEPGLTLRDYVDGRQVDQGATCK